jgi:hypothetical protein
MLLGFPLWLTRRLTRAAFRLLVLALVTCMRLRDRLGDSAWRIAELRMERALRDARRQRDG